MPVTMPVAGSTDARAVLLLLQLPPAVALLNGVVRPRHTELVPVIAVGSGFTVYTCVV